MFDVCWGGVLYCLKMFFHLHYNEQEFFYSLSNRKSLLLVSNLQVNVSFFNLEFIIRVLIDKLHFQLRSYL